MFQRKDGFWVERIVENGGKERRITAKSKSDLMKKLRDHTAIQEHGPLFSEIADQWLEWKSENIGLTSQNSYTPHVRRAKAFFEGQHIDEITPAMCSGFVQHLVNQDFSRDSVGRGLCILHQIFQFAICQPRSTLRYDPTAAVKKPRGLPHTRREPPTPDQLLVIDPSTPGGFLAFFLLRTGLRRGEALGLLWKDVDLENKTIYVRQRAQFPSNQPEIKEGAKSAAGVRSIPILPDLAAVLPEGMPPEHFVFGGAKPLTQTMFRKRWLAWCREVGLAEAETEEFTGKNGHRYKTTRWKPLITPHQLRHEYATMLYQAGVQDLDTKAVMGHSSILVTREIYQHIAQRDHQSQVSEKMTAYLAAQQKPKEKKENGLS